MQITVQRAPADSQGPDIIDELLTDPVVGVARGRGAVDRDCSDRIKEACQCPKHDYIETGLLALVTEADSQWRGLNRYWSLTLTIDGDGLQFTADTRLTIEREARR